MHLPRDPSKPLSEEATGRASDTGTDDSSPDNPSRFSGQGFLRAVLWGDVLVSFALLFPALTFYQPSVRLYAVAGIVLSLGVEVRAIRAVRRGAPRSGALLLCLAGLFGFYAVHNFVWLGMTSLRPTWHGVVFVLAGAFFAWAAVGVLRLWSRW